MLPTSDFRCAAALSCAAALFLAGCATPCKTTVEPGRHSLAKGVPVQVSRDTQLTLVAIDDSRCPAGVRCIWAGKIAYQFELSSCGKTERFALSAADRATAPGKYPTHTFASAPAMHISLVQEPEAPAGTVHSVSVVLGAN